MSAVSRKKVGYPTLVTIVPEYPPISLGNKDIIEEKTAY